MQFGLNLAREWASFPVLSATKGEHRDVARGQSYYAGDRLNKSLVKPEQVEQRLRHVRELAALMTEADKTATIAPKPSTAGRGGGGASVAPVKNVDPEKLDRPKAKPVRKSGRFWAWLLAGGISSTTITEKLGAFQLDWRVQIALLAVIVGSAVDAIATMPAVRRALGIGVLNTVKTALVAIGGAVAGIAATYATMLAAAFQVGTSAMWISDLVFLALGRWIENKRTPG
ncbi:hypothetical protein [Agrobacterium sp. NPDC089420]|uniref:hypothetical protein n=1 Tax=Agrobacterium sp. NPDC089420 TaxID=3363918 RepID=UPI00384DC469